MEGKVCLVTGANGGLGKAVSLGLARQGATVVMACRNQARGEAALAEVRAACGNNRAELLLLDLSSLQAVRSFARQFKQKYNRLDVLINNAAIFTRTRQVTADGLEAMFATNHLGHFLLTNLLLDELKAAKTARVITVTAPSTVKLNFADLQSEQKFKGLTVFGASKTCNLLFGFALANRLEGTGLTSNLAYPGLVRSNLMKEAALPVRLFSQLVSASAEKAALNLLYMANGPELEGVTGKFYKGSKVLNPPAYTLDGKTQQRLWETSMKLTGPIL